MVFLARKYYICCLPVKLITLIIYKVNLAKNISWHLWLFTFLFCAASCKQSQSPADPGKFTDEFIPISNKVDKLFDNEPAKGLAYLESAFKTIPHPSVHDRVRFYGLHFVYQKKLLKDYKVALIYADSMIMAANSGGDANKYPSAVAEAYFAKGDAYFEINRYNDAYEAYYKGYLTGKNSLNSEVLADYTYRMGMVMYKQKNYKLAVSYFKDSFKQSMPTRNDFPGFYRKQELLDNIGLSYRRNDEPDSAIVYFDKALTFIDKFEGKFGEKNKLLNMARGVVYGNKADIYIKQKAYDKATALLKKSIAINLKKGNDNADAQLSQIKLGQIYFETGQFDLLFNLLNDLRGELNSVKNPEAEADWNRLMGNYYIHKNELAKALQYLQRYNVVKDSLAELSRLILKSDVDQQLANYENQRKIDALSDDNNLKVIYLYVSVFFAIMATIIVFLVFRNWKRSKKDVKMVHVLNKQINEQNHILENTLNDLKNSSQEKDRILRTVAHDLRNPIGGIASLTSMMADDDYTDDQKELINLVKETSTNSLELINEILEATNLTSVELNLEDVEINSLVSNSVELLRFKAAEKGQQILLDTLENQQTLYISREKIWRVLGNLISNAIKFSPTGGTIYVKVAEVAHKIVIAVKDNGIGIPDKMRDQVFNMFTSAQRAGTAGEKSFGLGLSICKQIIDKHHGKIWFENNLDNGTTFFISLPTNNAGHPKDGLSEEVSVPQP